MEPLLCLIIPDIIFNKVVFPDPLEPRSPMQLDLNSRLICFKMLLLLSVKLISFKSNFKYSKNMVVNYILYMK